MIPCFNPCAYATEFPGYHEKRYNCIRTYVLGARTREVNEVTRRWRDARDSFTRCIALHERQTTLKSWILSSLKFQRDDAWNGDFALVWNCQGCAKVMEIFKNSILNKKNIHHGRRSRLLTQKWNKPIINFHANILETIVIDNLTLLNDRIVKSLHNREDKCKSLGN